MPSRYMPQLIIQNRHHLIHPLPVNLDPHHLPHLLIPQEKQHSRYLRNSKSITDFLNEPVLRPIY